MTDSVSEYLDRELECLDLLECVHGLTELDRTAFVLLVDVAEPLTVDCGSRTRSQPTCNGSSTTGTLASAC